MGAFPFSRQLDQMDCGPTCLQMISRFHGRTWSLAFLRDKAHITREGVSFAGIAAAAEAIGYRAASLRVPFELLIEDVPLPLIAHWQGNHFIVVYSVTPDAVCVADPAVGLLTLSRAEFEAGWASEGVGLILALELSPDFVADDVVDPYPARSGFRLLTPYLAPYQRYFVQIGIGLAAATVMGLSLPFLTQQLVDSGVIYGDVGFVWLMLGSQLLIFVGRTAIELIRSWTVLYIGARVNIAIISDYLRKLMRLPVRFFDSKTTGDILQRIDDHRRVERFLTSSTVETIFSLFHLILFSLVLGLYSLKILALFAIGSAASIVWILFFLKRRQVLNHREFTIRASTQGMLIELLQGMMEIKIHNCEREKRWAWERIQVRLFRVVERLLVVTQVQQAGSSAITELKNILIAFVAAREVIAGEMSLGMMLAASYILGAANRPIDQLLGLATAAQDARLSLTRLGEIHGRTDEEDGQRPLIANLPTQAPIVLRGLCFQYDIAAQEPTLADLDLIIPPGKVTAIVGASGSGKTTLLKLLLRFYEPNAGELLLGGAPLSSYSAGAWRERCGVVMQDGYIFSETIAANVGLGAEHIDPQRLKDALHTANILDFVESLPLSYNTRIGAEGHGLSQGQRQRLLIARAIYKNPDWLFFDEATSALDANNERAIMANLDTFLRGRTSVVIAHRLSTVRSADQIIVLNRGRIVEQGDHSSLIAERGYYFSLIRNQLELGD